MMKRNPELTVSKIVPIWNEVTEKKKKNPHERIGCLREEVRKGISLFYKKPQYYISIIYYYISNFSSIF